MAILSLPGVESLPVSASRDRSSSYSDAVAASDFQVFTREGRHIAGTALTADTT